MHAYELKYWCTQKKIECWVSKRRNKVHWKIAITLCKHYFCWKIRYDRNFQEVTHKGGEYEINYIKILQNAHALSVSVGNVYSYDQLMHTFLDNFHQGGKYSAQIASHQAELRREKILPIINHWTSHRYIMIT